MIRGPWWWRRKNLEKFGSSRTTRKLPRTAERDLEDYSHSIKSEDMKTRHSIFVPNNELSDKMTDNVAQKQAL